MAWQYNILILENLAANLADGVALVNGPVQVKLLDRIIFSDSVKVFPAGNFVDQMVLFDGLRFALAGGTAQEVLFLSDRNILQDAFHNPNLQLSQMPRELVLLPSSTNIRLTQMPRELVLLPSSPNIRLTQMARELVMLYPEAFLAEEDYQMSIGDQLFMQEGIKGQSAGLFFLSFGERNSPGMKDQTGDANVKVKNNQNIKASNLQSSDTTLNHWLDAITATVIPGNTAQTLSDQITMTDALASQLPVTIAEVFAEQLPSMTDATPVKIMGMQQPFIQTINLWQEFFAQPYLGIFSENMQDQWQDSLAGFMPYFMPLSDQMTLTDSLLLPMAQALSDQLTMTDSVVEVFGYLTMLVDALSLNDSLAFNNPQSYQDQLTMTDSFVIAEALDELLADDGSGNWADAITEVLGTSSFQDQLVLSDSFTLGYGNYIPDQLLMTDSDALLFGMGMSVAEQFLLNDQFGEFPNGLLITEQLQFSDTIQLPVWLVLADQLVQADALGAGYGNAETDVNTMADSMRLVESFEALLQDASPAQLDSLNTLFNFLVAIDDQVFMVEQLYIMYGLLIDGQFLEFDDEINVVGVVLPNLADDIANWLDAVLAELVFAPTDVVVRDIRVLAQLVNTFAVQAQQQANDAVVKPRTQQTNSIEVLDVIDGQ